MSQNIGVNTPLMHLESLGLRLESYPNFLALPAEKRLAVSVSVIPLTGKGFMRFEIDKELTDDVNDHVAESPRLLVLYDKEANPVAFVCSGINEWQGYSVYELHGIIVDPSLQGNGVGKSLLLYDIIPLRPEILRLTTQNQDMYQLAGKLAFLSDNLAIEMAEQRYNIDGQIIRRLYRGGNCLYGDVEKFASHAISRINWQNGDALVVAGFFRKSLF